MTFPLGLVGADSAAALIPCIGGPLHGLRVVDIGATLSVPGRPVPQPIVRRAGEALPPSTVGPGVWAYTRYYHDADGPSGSYAVVYVLDDLPRAEVSARLVEVLATPLGEAAPPVIDPGRELAAQRAALIAAGYLDP